MEGLSKEPLSVWTNAAYAVVGVIVLLAPGGAAGVVYGLSLILLALGSFAYHAGRKTNPPSWGQRADEMGMYLVLSAAIGVITGAWVPCLVLATTLTIGHYHIDSMKVVPALGAAAFLALGLVSGWGPAGLVLLIFLVAGVARFLFSSDLSHAAWHVLSAYGFFEIWRAA